MKNNMPNRPNSLKNCIKKLCGCVLHPFWVHGLGRSEWQRGGLQSHADECPYGHWQDGWACNKG